MTGPASDLGWGIFGCGIAIGIGLRCGMGRIAEAIERLADAFLEDGETDDEETAPGARADAVPPNPLNARQ